ncbi:hypothetical protein FHX10_004568 [Rhizobium sp. BK591]|nr:hypothetical protein [Rhizobium sp. BK112]MBB3370641.1 hypothetical protein [Rhizobium sp. BK077]MBB3745031.1 hypothetical protein [Rhizobium sp. BK591]MBB4181190.1 hypothetical protein [Rhizobium sp. BK109]
MKSPAGKISRAFLQELALSADSGFLDDRVAVTADFFRLGEAILGDVARPHVMAVIGPFRIAVSGTRVVRGDGYTCRLGRHCGKDRCCGERAGKDNLFHDKSLFLSWSFWVGQGINSPEAPSVQSHSVTDCVEGRNLYGR